MATLTPPICLEVVFRDTTISGDDPSGANFYRVNMRITAQSFSPNSTYTGANIAVGMFTSNTNVGMIWRISHIFSQSATAAYLQLEDISGLNARIDPTGGSGGNPPDTPSSG